MKFVIGSSLCFNRCSEEVPGGDVTEKSPFGDVAVNNWIFFTSGMKISYWSKIVLQDSIN